MKEKQQNKKIQKQKSAEEQQEEIEALKSIFQDDFEQLYTGQDSTYKFAITIDASGDKNTSFAAVKMEISFGAFYPKIPPTIRVSKLKGISDVFSLPYFILHIQVYNTSHLYERKLTHNYQRTQIYAIHATPPHLHMHTQSFANPITCSHACDTTTQDAKDAHIVQKPHNAKAAQRKSQLHKTHVVNTSARTTHRRTQGDTQAPADCKGKSLINLAGQLATTPSIVK